MSISYERVSGVRGKTEILALSFDDIFPTDRPTNIFSLSADRSVTKRNIKYSAI
jgi:hypothetical protein